VVKPVIGLEATQFSIKVITFFLLKHSF